MLKLSNQQGQNFMLNFQKQKGDEMTAFKVFLGNKENDTVFYNDIFLKGFKNLQEVKDYIKKD